ncbi:Peptidase A1 domain-containing protein [Aphelenchoides fujianensis]|nr:Peptidase A1 domain-containing protein [Aphelenchoides fujianensis]
MNRFFVLLLAALVVELVGAKGSFQVSIAKPRLSTQHFRSIRPLSTSRAARLRPQKFASGGQNFTDYMDLFYAGNITIGTPPQQFQVEFDTDRASSWVLDDSCTDEQMCEGQYNPGIGKWKKQKFHRNQSSTFQKNDTQFYEYVLGTGVYGYLGVDTFVVGGISVKKQAFGMIDTVEGYFPYYPYDGVLGLGWPSIAEDGETPVFQNMIPQLDAPIFNLWLDRHVKPSKGNAGGQITFGALDTTNCDAPLVYSPLVREAEWVFNVDA